MKNFQPGGLRNRKPDLGGRPHSDVNKYAPKQRYDERPAASKYGDKKDITLYKTNCTTCGKECEVPFRPDGKKPVLCRDCFAAKNAAGTEAYQRGDKPAFNKPQQRDFASTAPRPAAPRDTAEIAALTKQITALESKVTQILEILRTPKTKEVTAKAPVAAAEKAVTSDEAVVEKARKPKKVTPAIKKAAVKKKTAVAKKIAKKVAKKETK